MPLTPIANFCAGSYNSRARGASATRTVNMRIEQNMDPASKSPFTLFPRSGKKLFTTLKTPGAGVQGMWANKTRVFVVCGGMLYEIFEDTSSHAAGPIAVGGNPATMRANGLQLLVCSAGNVYLYNGVSLFRPIISYATGTVNVNGNAVSWVSGALFQGAGGDVLPGDLFMIGTTLYNVIAVTDATDLVLDKDAGMIEDVAYQAGTEYLTGVMPEFIDDYFIVSQPNTKQFRLSALGDGSTWDELDFADKSGSIDNIGAIQEVNGQLALIGDTSQTEVWGDSGNADFPFTRVSGRNINAGTSAPWSVAKLADGSICSLLSTLRGEDQIVHSAGGAPVRISDHGIENAMRSYPLVYDAIGSTYLEGGHSIYRIDFPTANRTWEWDQTAGGVWSEMGPETPEDEVYGADPGTFRVHVTWPSGTRMDLVAGFASGKIWQVSPDFDQDDGVDIPVMRISPHINSNLEMQNIKCFALDCELGTIDPANLGLDGKPLIPTVNLATSSDGARTWVDAGAASLGRSGEYEGTFLTPDEITDMTQNSQTNPQVFDPKPVWYSLGAFWISKTFKIKSTARQLKAIYNALIELGPS